MTIKENVWLSKPTLNLKSENSLTCSEVKDNVTEKYRIRDDVEYNSTHGQIVIEKRDGNRKYDEISDEEQQHADIPVEP